jgi:hypothetical protein
MAFKAVQFAMEFVTVIHERQSPDRIVCSNPSPAR